MPEPQDREAASARIRTGAALWLGVLLLACASSSHAQLAADVYGTAVSDNGDYYYDGEEYRVGDAIDDTFGAVQQAFGTIGEASAFINRATSFGAWRQFDGGNGYVGTRTSVGFFSPSYVLPQGVLQRRNVRGLRVGPFYISNPYMGAGLLYSEYQGQPLTGRFRDDDPWAAIIWASVGVSAYVSDRFALSLRPFVYYLPLENKFGWTAGSSFFGLNSGSGLYPRSILEMAYRIPVGRWDLSVYDRFNAALARTTILDEDLFFYAVAQDMSVYDTAGRHALGGFGVPITDATGRANFEFNDRLFDGNRTFFQNTAGAMLNGYLGENLRASFFYRRYDHWNEDFDHLYAWNTAGALIVHEQPRLTKYAGYTVTHREGADSLVQMAFVGANAQLSSRLTADARAGYLWIDAGSQSRESAMGRIRLDHQLGPFTRHGVVAGRTVTDPDFGTSYLADFVRYYLSQQLSYRSQLRLFAQYTEAERLDTQTLSDYSSLVAGALLWVSFSPRDSLTILNSYEAYNLSGVDREWEVWTHRLAYLRRLSDHTSAHFYYQYQHANSGSVNGRRDFAEHLVYLGVVKRF